MKIRDGFMSRAGLLVGLSGGRAARAASGAAGAATVGLAAPLLPLLVAALPAFGWKRVGLTLRQARGSLTAALPVALLYCAFFTALALYFPDDPSGAEEIAFQLTMPGLEEEPFYRGILLFALDRAFTRRVRFLGVKEHMTSAQIEGFFAAERGSGTG